MCLSYITLLWDFYISAMQYFIADKITEMKKKTEQMSKMIFWL